MHQKQWKILKVQIAFINAVNIVYREIQCQVISKPAPKIKSGAIYMNLS